MRHHEFHRAGRGAWLRASVLGANDGLISTASLMVGIASAGMALDTLLLTGVAALLAGAMSMAAGEYVSVSSQSDIERADLAKERHELAQTPDAEHRELTQIYIHRGLTPELAEQVATQMTEHDALAAHARDELGITSLTQARPGLAALASGMAFSCGALLPLAVIWFAPASQRVTWLSITTLVFLGALGALGARLGGAPIYRAALRVAFFGVMALGATALLGRLFQVNLGGG